MSSVFGIGLTGLNAAQVNLATIGHNIANATNPGYHRQRVELQASFPQNSSEGFLGTGVEVRTVKRMYSEFLDSQVATAQGRLSYLNNYRDLISQIDNLLADPNAGLTPAIGEFFVGLQELGADPESPVTRQGLLSAAATLVGRFQSLEARLSGMVEGANRQVQALVTSINGLASEIASLNRSIVRAEAGSAGQPANDLYDKRDALVSQLNGLTGATTVLQSDGTVNVMIGNGQNLVVGETALTLAAIPSTEDVRRYEIGYLTGGVTSIITSSLNAGELGAMLAFQKDTLDVTLNSLGRIATTLAYTFNQQHRLGQDLNGAFGQDFFVVPAPEVLSRTNNAGTGVLSATLIDPGSLTTSDYRVTYNPTGYTVTRLSDNTSTTYATLPQTIDGVQIALASGTPVNGDSFLVRPTRGGAKAIDVALTEGAEIAAASPIRAQAAPANTGSAVVTAGVVNGPPPVNVNLTQPVTITFTAAGTFDVTGTGTGSPTGVAYTSGSTISYNGWSLTISGAPRAGDVFTVRPNTGGVSDNRNANLLADLQGAQTIGGGAATYQSAYSQSVANVGAKTRELTVASSAQQTLVDQTNAAQQSMSGVNLDEEAANLIRYQQMYQAAGKMIEIASRLFESLLAI